MRFNLISAATLALAPLSALAAALPETGSGDLEVIHQSVDANGITFKIYAPLNQTSAIEDTSSVEKRDSCSNTGANFNRGDAQSLQNSLQGTNPDYLEYMPAQTLVSYEWGTAKVCINNWYVFENTHLKRWEAGWAVGTILGNCCGGSSCNGGQTTCHGDSGLSLEATLKHTSRPCRGPV